MKSLVLFVILAGAAQAQLVLFTFDGSTNIESPVGATFNFGSVATSANKDVRFRVHNAGTSPVTVQTLAASGMGFSIAAVNGSLPYPIAPANFLEFTIRFTAATPAAYSANLQVNTISVLLLATVVTPPVLSSVSGCTISAQSFDFGNVPIGTQHLCNFSLYNPTGQPMVISTIGLTGGFVFQQKPSTPLTLAPSQATSFTIVITPVCGNVLYGGTLIINSSQASQTFPLIASGITPPLAKPLLSFDATTFASAEQHSIALSLPSPSPCGATGNLNLAFTPNYSAVTGDSAVVFVKGNTRSLQFSVLPNSTAVSIAGQPTATFQTGTTAGSILFTLTGTAFTADPATTISISPSVITIDSASASNQRLGQLDVEVIGFDNTYSAGAMSFTFFDTAGTQVGATVSADFTAPFKSYFTAQTGGSAFLMRVSFPVIGDQTKVGRVLATLTNSAGTTQTGSLTFR